MCQSETGSPESHNPELFIRVPQTRAREGERELFPIVQNNFLSEVLVTF